jgi:hypothetical protein
MVELCDGLPWAAGPQVPDHEPDTGPNKEPVQAGGLYLYAIHSLP